MFAILDSKGAAILRHEMPKQVSSLADGDNGLVSPRIGVDVAAGGQRVGEGEVGPGKGDVFTGLDDAFVNRHVNTAFNMVILTTQFPALVPLTPDFYKLSCNTIQISSNPNIMF